MAFTYDPANLASSLKDQVRLKIGDTETVKVAYQLLQDEEIEFILSESSDNILVASIECVKNIIGKLSKVADQKTGDIATWFTKRCNEFRELLKILMIEYATNYGVAYAGGISIEDKQEQESDTDRVEPSFSLGFMDNT